MNTYRNHLSILLVDDAELITNRIVRLVKENGIPHTMRVAATSADAKKLFDSGDYDTVILDIQLPDKSGMDLLRYLKKHPFSPKTIVMTNKATRHYRRECRVLGSDYFIDKSVEFERIPVLLHEISKAYDAQAAGFSEN